MNTEAREKRQAELVEWRAFCRRLEPGMVFTNAQCDKAFWKLKAQGKAAKRRARDGRVN